jgi:hypothetical protein
VCAIISGAILITSLVKIRNFFKENELDDFLNTPMMLRHSFAYGLYLLSTTGACISTMLVDLNGYQSWKLVKIDSIVSISDFFLQFVSQILLCQIVWALGADTKKAEIKMPKIKKPAPVEDNSIIVDGVRIDVILETAAVVAKDWD